MRTRRYRSAIRDNRMLPEASSRHRVRPASIAWRPSSGSRTSYLAEQYVDGPDLVVGVNALLSDLEPDPGADRVEAFEQAIFMLGMHLRLSRTPPEKETGNGPDDAWLSSGSSLVIECKSGATTDAIRRSDVAHSRWIRAGSASSTTATASRTQRRCSFTRHRQLMADAVAPPRPHTSHHLKSSRHSERRCSDPQRRSQMRASRSHKQFSSPTGQRHLNDRSFVEHWGRASAARRPVM